MPELSSDKTDEACSTSLASYCLLSIPAPARAIVLELPSGLQPVLDTLTREVAYISVVPLTSEPPPNSSPPHLCRIDCLLTSEDGKEQVLRPLSGSEADQAFRLLRRHGLL